MQDHQGLAGQARVREHVTSSVQADAILQVHPVLDRVHGFVIGNLLQQRGGRVPGEPLEAHEAGREPQRQEFGQLRRQQPQVHLARQRLVLGADQLRVGEKGDHITAQVGQELDAVLDLGHHAK